MREVTSGLPDDSREADEGAEARRLRGFRGSAEAARAVVSNTPGLSETPHADWRKPAMFYPKFGLTGGMFGEGVPVADRTQSAKSLSSIQ